MTLKSGKASMVMKKNGDIRISGKNITVKGGGKVTIRGEGDVKIKGKKTTS
jgi:type VI secretion system secreted protein VgrG